MNLYLRFASTLLIVGLGLTHLPAIAQTPERIRLLWSVGLQGSATHTSAPAVGPDGTVYATSYTEFRNTAGNLQRDVHLMAVGANGEERWRFDRPGQEAIPPVVRPDQSAVSPTVGVEGTIFFVAGSTLYAVTREGSEKWSRNIGSLLHAGPSSGADGTLYLGTDGGHLLAIASNNGKVLWSKLTGAPIRLPPVIGPDQTVYVVDSQGILYAVDPSETGATLKWSRATAESPPPPAPRALTLGPDGTILVLAGSLHAFQPDGSLMWRSDQIVDRSGTIAATAPVVGFFRGAAQAVPDWLITLGQTQNIISGTNIAGLAEVTTTSPPGHVTSVGPDGKLRVNATPAMSLSPNKPQFSSSPHVCPDSTLADTAGVIMYVPGGRTGRTLYAMTYYRGAYCVRSEYTLPVRNGDGFFGTPTIAPNGRVYVVARTKPVPHQQFSLYAFSGERPRQLEAGETAPPWPMFLHDARHTGMDSTQAPRVVGPSVSRDAMPTWTWASTAGTRGSGIFRFALNKADLGGEQKLAIDRYTPSTPLREGSHLLSVQEKLGNRWSNPGTYTIVVDKTPPSTRATLAIDDSGNRVVTLSCIDDTGSDCVTYYEEGGNRVRYERPFPIDELSTLSFWSVDSAGNEESHRPLQGGQAATRVSLDLSRLSLLQGESLEVSGKLTRLPHIDQPLKNHTIELQIARSDGSMLSPRFTGTGTAGHFRFSNVSGFSREDQYTLTARFAGTALLKESESEPASVHVGKSAGYALIVQGKQGEDTNDRQSHAKTTDRIYRSLRKRGFKHEHIRYFRYDVDPADNRGDIRVAGIPTKDLVKASIVRWAKDLMNGVPAPLYVILVNHGSRKVFHLDGQQITPGELNQWLRTLEKNLVNDARKKQRIIILGACHSGSFIPKLSRNGRVIVASAAAAEVSYKGPKEQHDGIRVGEYFLEELFRELGDGEALLRAFSRASDSTRIYTRRGGGPSNGNDFSDDAVQHPLLDDNGDKRGSNVLTAGGDGAQVANLFLGSNRAITTNSAGQTPVFTEVTPTRFLRKRQNTAVLQARVLDDNLITTPWVEVREPQFILTPDTRSSVQLKIDRDKHFLDRTGPNKWALKFKQFDAPGRYEVFYFVNYDNDNQDLAAGQRSIVYKDSADNNENPTPFALKRPDNGITTETTLLFSWGRSRDPDGVSYRLVIATDPRFEPASIVHIQEGLGVTVAAVDQSAGLEDLTTYYWRVEAVDGFGRRTTSETRHFNTNNTNGPPTVLWALVQSNSDFIQLASVEMSILGQRLDDMIVDCFNGKCIVVYRGGPLGSTQVTVSASGHLPQVTTAELRAGITTEVKVGLEPVDTNRTDPGGVPHPDFNGDGIADIVWRNKRATGIEAWEMKRLKPPTRQRHVLAPLPGNRWSVEGIADFSGDGKSDVLLRHAGKGIVRIWKMNGFARQASQNIGTKSGSQWQIVGVGDFDGNNIAGVLWHHARKGAVRIWQLNKDLQLQAARHIGSLRNRNWRVAGVADFNQDGKADVLLHHTRKGLVKIWEMEGLSVARTKFAGRRANANWQIVGVGDFNGDGTGDILWRHAKTGVTSIWLITDSRKTAARTLPGRMVGWEIARTGDYDGDRRTDIVWRHKRTGKVTLWLMNGTGLPRAVNIGKRDYARWAIR